MRILSGRFFSLSRVLCTAGFHCAQCAIAPLLLFMSAMVWGAALPVGADEAISFDADATEAAVPSATAEPLNGTPSAPVERNVIAKGLASWYGQRFHGRPTASGERFDMNQFTAAHKTLPFGTLVRVRSVRNGQEVVVRINDRGPYGRNRLIDLSRAAALAIGLKGRGVASVVLLTE